MVEDFGSSIALTKPTRDKNTSGGPEETGEVAGRTSALGERKTRPHSDSTHNHAATQRGFARREHLGERKTRPHSDSTHNHAATKRRRAHAARTYTRAKPTCLLCAPTPRRKTCPRGAHVRVCTVRALHARSMRLRSHADGAWPRHPPCRCASLGSLGPIRPDPDRQAGCASPGQLPRE